MTPQWAIGFPRPSVCFFSPPVTPPPPSLQALPSLSFTPSGLPPPLLSFFLWCQTQIYSACDVCRAEECEWAGREGGVQGQQGGRCVCTIRDKIMAPQGLVWPCTRSIKRRLQVPRSTLMSIFWGLILHAEHSHLQHTYTLVQAHTKHTLDIPA